MRIRWIPALVCLALVFGVAAYLRRTPFNAETGAPKVAAHPLTSGNGSGASLKRPDDHVESVPRDAEGSDIASSSIEPQSTSIIVSNLNGVPIVNAELRLLGTPRNQALGATDQSGRLQVTGLPANKQGDTGILFQVHALASGYLGKVVDLPLTSVAELVIQLASGARLAGLIEKPDGGAAGEGVMVIVGPQRWLSQSLAERLVSGEEPPGWHLRTTDKTGHFTVDGLQPELSYYVWAGAGDWLTREPTAAKANATDPIVVRTDYAWALQVELSEPDGSPIKSSGDYLLFGRDDISVMFDGPGVMLMPAYFALIAGVAGDSIRQSASKRFLLAVSESLSAPVIHFRFAPPGYVPLEQDVSLLPLTMLASSTVLTLRKAVDGFGIIDVAIVGIRSGATGIASPEFVLSLTDGKLGNLSLAFTAHKPLERLEGIPIDSYSARITSRATGLVFPPYSAPSIAITVGSEPYKVVFNLAECSELRLDIADQDGSTYTGQMAVTLTHGDLSKDGSTFQGSGDTLNFDSPPFVIRGLIPGKYSARVVNPPDVRFESGAPMTIFEVSEPRTVIVQPRRR